MMANLLPLGSSEKSMIGSDRMKNSQHSKLVYD